MGGRLGALLLALAAVACDGGASPPPIPPCVVADPLTAGEVRTVIAQAAARAAFDGQALTITVVSREGVVVGQLRMAGGATTEVNPRLGTVDLGFTGRGKARTAAFLSSNQHAFNTRTARFIIQNNFPPDVPNAPGGPLYGVQFSNLLCSDVVGEALTGPAKLFQQEGNGLSDDTGSMPLYKDGCLVGAVSVDGGPEPDDAVEERAAWTASMGFRPVTTIFGSVIHIDGVRVEFMDHRPADGEVTVAPYADLVTAGGVELVAPAGAPAEQGFATGTFGGLDCEIRYPVVDSPRPVPAAERLLASDIAAMLDAGAARSARTRAGIRRPLGTPMRCFISVVDTDGAILGSIRTPEATLFSFDVSIQKARTCAFFSADDFAMTCRAMGFLAQRYFPPGIDFAPRGPLANDYHLVVGPLPGPGEALAVQDALSIPLFFPIEGGACQDPVVAELPNGITVFPGGVPVYKSGVLVGAIGVSGDGVDQDDFIASAGGELFPPPPGARCDEVAEPLAVARLRSTVDAVRVQAQAAADAVGVSPMAEANALRIVDAALAADQRLSDTGLAGIRLPYVKFPRQPFIED